MLKKFGSMVVHSFNGNMDLGLHLTLTDSASIQNPELLAIAERITPQLSKDFGKVWDLFQTRSQPFQTDTYETMTRGYTTPVVSTGAIAADNTEWNNVADITALEVTAGTINRLTIGDILLIDDEIVVVKSVDRSGNTIDVYERGAGDTAGAAHTGTLDVKIIGNAHLEGVVDPEAMAEGTSANTNYCQIVEEVVDLSKEDTDQARKFGMTEATLKAEAMERVMRDLARTAVYGVARAGTSTIPAMTRGLISHLRDLSGAITTAVSGAFTETVLMDILDDVRAAGGSVNAIVLSPTNKRIANGFTGVDSIVTTRQDTVGGRLLDGYLADGLGVVPFVVDIDMPDNVVAVINTRFMEKGWKINDQLRFVKETNTNSRENKETLQGKFGLSMTNIGQSHGLLTAIV